MKRTQRGFSAVEALIIILIVGIVGFAGWYVWDANKKDDSGKKSSSSQESSNDSDTELQDTPAGTTYTDETAKISFLVPEAWKVTPKAHIGNDITRLTITSPDYASDANSPYGGSNEGSQVTIYVRDLSQPGFTIPTSSKLLAGDTQGSKEKYSEVKAARIAGSDGVSYKVGYEGPKRFVHQFEQGNTQYVIELQEDLDGPTFNANLETYQAIVTSLKLAN